jgi:FkbM family methyltransferase
MLPAKLKPGIYSLARKLRPVLPYGILANLGQWLSRYAHEPDFEVFEWLAETSGLVLDVGASRGQSALSILRRTRRMRVFSFEPNRKHRWSLLTILLLHPFRYRFRMVAAGDEACRQTLFIPGRRASGLSAQGSLDPAEFDKDYVRDRLAASGFDAGDKAGYRQLSVQVQPLDGLGLKPDFIKLDVEGFEQQALKGLAKTLESYPALLIEINNSQRWLPGLEKLGYAFYHYDESAKTLERAQDPPGVLNLFCLHGDSDSAITRTLLDYVKK